ncbi:LuxR C-terminal-related transcriptional regulator [Streptomyces sp. NPDC055092]
MGNGEPTVPESLHSAIEQILQQASAVTNEPALLRPRPHVGLSAQQALNAAERLVTAKLAEHHGSHTTESQLATVLIGLQTIRNTVQGAELARRTALVGNVRLALERLRRMTSIAELVERAPVEAAGLGYQRCLLSRLKGTDWSARAAYAHGDPWLSQELVRIGTETPGRLGRELPETELVRRRTPVLVRDAQRRARVHRALISLSGTDDYVAAPLIVRGDVVGLIHVDRHADPEPVDTYDQEMLGLFAEGLAFGLERLFYQEQLAALRGRLEDQARSVSELIEGPLGADAMTSSQPQKRAAVAQSAEAAALLQHSRQWPLCELTRRELEVLEHLIDGESNTDIAAKLYVSAETVKTHVKNLLRKLGAANRSEAVSVVREIACGRQPARESQ